MTITAIIAQLRTTDLAASIRFYTERLGFTLAFQYEDFYAGVRAGAQMIHLKLVDTPDPSIDFVRTGDHIHLYIEIDDACAFAATLRERDVALLRGVEDKPWGMREFVIADDQGHTLYFGQDIGVYSAAQQTRPEAEAG